MNECPIPVFACWGSLPRRRGPSLPPSGAPSAPACRTCRELETQIPGMAEEAAALNWIKQSQVPGMPKNKS